MTSPRVMWRQRVASMPFLGVSRCERGTRARHPRACRVGTCVPDVRACPPTRARSSECGVMDGAGSGRSVTCRAAGQLTKNSPVQTLSTIQESRSPESSRLDTSMCLVLLACAHGPGGPSDSVYDAGGARVERAETVGNG